MLTPYIQYQKTPNINIISKDKKQSNQKITKQVKSKMMKKLKDSILSIFENKIDIPKEIQEEYQNFEDVKKLVEKTRISRWIYILVYPCITIIESLIQLIYINISSSLNDSLINDSNSLTLSLILKYIFFHNIIFNTLSFIGGRLECKMCEVNQNTEKYLLEHVLTFDYNFFEVNKTTQIMDLFQNVNYLVSYLTTPQRIIKQICQDITIFGLSFFIFKVCPWQISLMSIFLSLGVQILKQIIQKSKLKQEKSTSNKIQYQEFLLNDTLKNISLIKQFGTERKEIDNLFRTFKNNKDYQKKIFFKGDQTLLENVVSLIQDHMKDIIMLSLLAQLYLMRKSDPLQSRNFTLDISLILSYSYFINKATNTLYLYYSKLTGKQHSSKNQMIVRIIKLAQFLRYKTTIPTSINEVESPQQNQYLIGDIQFKNICFKYPQVFDIMATMNQIKSQLNKNEDSDKKEDKSIDLLELKGIPKEVVSNVLNDISFKIKSGQFVSFVGKSGSGKSTIVKLIQRFYNMSSGDILFNGQSINEISIVKLKNSIGFVSQDPCLLDNDIETNITYGNQEQYSQEYLKEICDISGVSEFIFDKKRFPQQLKTLVGQNGDKLSGGQKQRIAIARALFKKPQILILDEATSSLDAENENIVQQYIDSLVEKRGMTIIVVAHRLSTVIKSDSIFVMEQGKIVEKGSHQELLQLDGVYKKLISHQIHS